MPRRTPQAVPAVYAVFSASVVTTAFTIAWFTWAVAPLNVTLTLVVLLVAAVLAEMFAVSLPGGATTSLAFPLTVAAIILLGPAGAMLIAIASAVSVQDLRGDKPFSVVAFNIGQISLVALVAAWTYDLAIEWALPAAWAPYVAAVLCVVVATLGNDVVVGAGIHLYRRIPFAEVWHSGIRWMLPTQFALAGVGILIAESIRVSLWAALLFAVPLLIAQTVFTRSGEYREALRDTIRAFVGLLEAKDPYTRGHSERVAQYSKRLGAQLALSRPALERLEFAALLHDLGKVAVPTEVLRKVTALTESEMATVRVHPEEGGRLVSKIPGFSELATCIAHHHERFDGLGYGEGLVGEQIPRLARVLAVADSYDAMTTDRPYRARMSDADALAEIERGAGRQFDPEVAIAFIDLQVGS